MERRARAPPSAPRCGRAAHPPSSSQCPCRSRRFQIRNSSRLGDSAPRAKAGSSDSPHRSNHRTILLGDSTRRHHCSTSLRGHWRPARSRSRRSGTIRRPGKSNSRTDRRWRNASASDRSGYGARNTAPSSTRSRRRRWSSASHTAAYGACAACASSSSGRRPVRARRARRPGQAGSNRAAPSAWKTTGRVISPGDRSRPRPWQLPPCLPFDTR